MSLSFNIRLLSVNTVFAGNIFSFISCFPKPLKERKTSVGGKLIDCIISSQVYKKIEWGICKGSFLQPGNNKRVN